MQGYPLSPKFFCFFVDLTLRDSEILSTMTETGNLFAYADDLASTFLNQTHTIEVMTEFKYLEKDNLTIHIGKTKFLTADEGITEAAAEVEVGAVKSFKYLKVEIHMGKDYTIKAAVKRF